MSSWDPVWEKIFSEREGWGRYPPEELVRFIAHSYYAEPERSQVKILEIGCGPGGGPSWFIAREGFDYYGVDGSVTAIVKAQQYFKSERLYGNFVEVDLLNLPWIDNHFDCVVDVACLQCNSEVETSDILTEVRRVLKAGGRHFSMTLGAGSWGEGLGETIDSTTYIAVSEGPFSGMGKTRFADHGSLISLYSQFKKLELNCSDRTLENGSRNIRNWIVTCEK